MDICAVANVDMAIPPENTKNMNIYTAIYAVLATTICSTGVALILMNLTKRRRFLLCLFCSWLL